MKKILTHLTGIVFLTTILVAGACSQTEVPKPVQEDLSEVIISVKSQPENGENHLLLVDSNNPENEVVDSLITYVTDSTEVYWVLAEDSGLEKIKKVKPKKRGGKIMPGRAKGNWSQTKYKKHVVPGNQESGNEEAYFIRVKDLDGNKWKIDPYLRIRQ